jgi:hypothetical protein
MGFNDGRSGWQISPELSHGSTTAWQKTGGGPYGGYDGNQQPQQPGYTGPRIAGQPGTGIHASQVWNPTKHRWTNNPTGLVVPPEWAQHPGAYIYKMTHGGIPQNPATPPPDTPPAPPQGYFGDLEQQWQAFSSNPRDWAPGTDMTQAHQNFIDAGGLGYSQGAPLAAPFDPRYNPMLTAP